MIGETVQLPIDQIRTNGGTQPRSCSNADVVADYSIAMEAGDQFPPVVVFYHGTNYWLADGFHRLGAAEKSLILREVYRRWNVVADDDNQADAAAAPQNWPCSDGCS